LKSFLVLLHVNSIVTENVLLIPHTL